MNLNTLARTTGGRERLAMHSQIDAGRGPPPPPAAGAGTGDCSIFIYVYTYIYIYNIHYQIISGMNTCMYLCICMRICL